MTGEPSFPAGSVPGPRAPKWLQSLQYTRAPIRHWERLHARYGDFGRGSFNAYGDVVWISSPSDIEQVLRQDPKVIHAGEAVRFLEPILGSKSMLVLDEDEHLRKRRALLPGFHGDSLARLEGVIQQAVDEAISRWPVGQRFKLLPHMKALSLEVILRAVFGVQDTEQLESIRHRVAALVDSFHLVIWGRRRRRRIAMHDPWEEFEARKLAADEAVARAIASRREAPDVSRRADVLSRLIWAERESGEPRGDEELRDDLMTLLIAGHETTSVAMTWAIGLLARNPRVLESVRAATRSTAGEGYLQAVIKECLRLRPIVPFTGRTLTQPLTVRACRLPAGTKLWIPILLVHVIPELYPQPHEFLPERFLNGGAPEPYTWLPFGGGVRRCIGAGLANLEMKVVLRSVARRVTLRREIAPLEQERANGVTLVPRRGGQVVVEACAVA